MARLAPLFGFSLSLFCAPALTAAAAQGSVDTAWLYQGPPETFPVNFDVSDSGLTVACFSPDVPGIPVLPLVVALDQAGKELWNYRTLDSAARVAYHPGGEVSIAEGVRASNPLVPNVSGAWDGYLTRVDTTGQIMWQTRFGGDGTEGVSSIKAVGGDVIVAGSSSSALGFGVSGSDTNGYVASFDSNGTLSWVTRIDGPPGSELSIKHMDVAANGASTVVGRFGFSPDYTSRLFQAELDPSGQLTSFSAGLFGGYTSIRYMASGETLTTARRQLGGTPSMTIGEICLTGSSWRCLSLPPAQSSSNYITGADQLSSGALLYSSIEAAPAFQGLTLINAATGALIERRDVRLTAGQDIGLHGIEIDDRRTVRAMTYFGPFSGGIVRLEPFRPIVSQVCSGAPNSTGTSATISATGTDVRASNDFVLTVKGLPVSSTTLFIASQATGTTINPGGSQGTLCLGGAIGRFLAPGQIQSSSAFGNATLGVDLGAVPRPTSSQSAAAGETWFFQAWYRDSNPAATSNFSSALSVTLR